MRGLVVTCLLLTVLATALAGSKHQCKNYQYEGCRLFRGQCTCETLQACYNPFPYNTEKECLDDVKGLNNQCAGRPCAHGFCTQILHHGRRGWYCECAGTGWFGEKCEKRCPRGNEVTKEYPTACVMTDDIYPDNV